MHKIQIGPKIFKEYPESIEEMTTEQYIKFVRLVLLYQSGNLNYIEFSKNLTYMLLDMVRRIDIEKNKNADKILENLSILMQLNDAFFEERTNEDGNVVKVINTDYTTNLVPEIKVGDQIYKGPSEALLNTCFGEYVTAQNAYIDFSESGEETDLDWLIATLYRPVCEKRKKQHLNDIREPFNKNKIEYFASQIKNDDEIQRLAFEYKYAIYLWFASCQKFIVTNDELNLSGGVSVDLSSLFKSSGSSDNGIGMAGVIFDLAETNVFGTSDDVERKPTYDVLVHMVQTKQKSEKLKRDAKNK